jgi:aspartate racemase
MRTNNYLKIGVLGGMGPEASATFYLSLIKLFQTELKARHNFEYPEMMIHNIPSPDNVEAGVDDELKDYLLNSVESLEKTGMQLLAIPCNSAHVHIEAVTAASKVTVMNILEETALAVSKAKVRRVLILGTESTLKQEIYPPHLERHKIEVVVPSPDHQEVITCAIMAVCEGTNDGTTKRQVLDVIESYPDTEGVVLGCTEIPLIVNQQDMDVPCFDTLQILVRATFERCQAGGRSPQL